MAILANDLNEADAAAQAKKSILDRVTELDGKITFEDFWGAKGFAYKIHGEKWGYYFVTQFEIDPNKITELEREWNIDKKLVRFLLTTVTGKLENPVKYSELLENQAASKKEAEIAAVEAKATLTAKRAAVKKETAAPAKTEKTEEKKDSVDRKFDAILDDASLDL